LGFKDAKQIRISSAGFGLVLGQVPKGRLNQLSKGTPWKRVSAVPPGLISIRYLHPALKRRAIFDRSSGT
jgi:hypothetical protein